MDVDEGHHHRYPAGTGVAVDRPDGVPAGAQWTRLIIRARVAYRPLWAVPLIELMLDVGDFVNVSFMLRRIKRLAEGDA